MLLPLFDRNPHKRFPWLVVLIIAANVFCFMQSISQDPPIPSFIKTVYEYGFVPLRLTLVDDPQPVVVETQIEIEGEPKILRAQLSTETSEVYATFFTMMFLHGGWLHLFSNMWMLWVFGDNIEDRLGRFVFIFFYLVGGVVAVLTQWAFDPESTQPVIGASGAVAAILGAYMVTFPLAKVGVIIVPIPFIFNLPSFLVLGGWFCLQMFAGIKGWFQPEDLDISVAFWAHIGGFVAGALLMPMLTIGASPPDEDWRTESQELFDL